MNALTLAAWCAAIFLAANLFSHTVALRLVMLGLGTLLVVVALVRERRQKGPPSFNPVPPLWLPFALWAAWAALSYFWSIEPERTVKEFKNEIVYVAAAFWMCWCAAQAKGAARIIGPVVAIGAVGACTSALYYFIGKNIWEYPNGPHGGAGNHSSAIITLMPCAAAAAWLAWQERWSRLAQILLWAFAAILLLSSYTTLSRTLWLVLAVQYVALGVLLIRRSHLRQLGSIKSRTVLVAAAITILFLSVGVGLMWRVQAERADSGVANELTEDPRLRLWPAVIERIKERPVLGHGFGRGMLRATFRKELGDGSLWHAHNLVLEVALQVGLVGFALLAALLYLTARFGWQHAASRNANTAACGIALFAVVLGMLMRNMTDVLWVRQNALLYWGVVSLLLAWGPYRVPPAGRVAGQ
jgi:O-antigen ligase